MATPEHMNYYMKLVDNRLTFDFIKKKKEEIKKKKNTKKDICDFEIITKEDILKSK